ncbi:MAG: hypothetical protein AB7P20_02455 [Rhizobiaceae bacterium]|jgi:hypothetical protein|nr:hypothetical protein [Pseudomonadota bacterium]
MKTISQITAVAIALSIPAIAFAQELTIDGTAAAIREVVSGKTCVGKDVLKFGESTVGSPGTFKRAGHSEARYAVGYGTILIRRGRDLHGHVTAVSVLDRKLYVSAETYQCEPRVRTDATFNKLSD